MSHFTLNLKWHTSTCSFYGQAQFDQLFWVILKARPFYRLKCFGTLLKDGQLIDSWESKVIEFKCR